MDRRGLTSGGGCKRQLITDANGTPLLVTTTPANRRDEQPLIEMLMALPVKIVAIMGDRGYGFAWTIAAVLAMGLVSLLDPRGTPHGSGLGKRRYVVERSLAILGSYRRIKFCYERDGERFRGYNVMAASFMCYRKLMQTTGGL